LRTTILCALVALAAGGCAHPQEEAVLARFFQLSRLRDRTALQDVATVLFEPHERGIVARFEITGFSPERRRRAAPDDRVVVLSAWSPKEAHPPAPAGEVDVIAEDVTIAAALRHFDGSESNQTLVVSLERSDWGAGRWIVTGVR
jgi:hypothetical protein